MGSRWCRPGAPADMVALPATFKGRLGATAVRGGSASGAHPMSRRGRRRASRRRLRPRTPEEPHAAPPYSRGSADAGHARSASSSTRGRRSSGAEACRARLLTSVTSSHTCQTEVATRTRYGQCACEESCQLSARRVLWENS